MARPASEEEAVERAIRPRALADYVGQDPRQGAAGDLHQRGARPRGEALDHVLIFGPPGWARRPWRTSSPTELGVNLRQTSGPVLERPGDLAAILTNLQARDVLFIDEIHRLTPVVEEVLYPAMEDYQLDIMIGEGPAARSIKLNLPPFTLVGATTRAGLLTSPLRDRFGIVQRLEFYELADLERIVQRSAGILGVAIDEGGAPAHRAALARHAAHRQPAAAPGARLCAGAGRRPHRRGGRGRRAGPAGSGPRGLRHARPQAPDGDHRAFDGGPVGIDSLAAAIGEERGTLEDVIEPFLIQQGFLMRTARGRDGHADRLPALWPQGPGTRRRHPAAVRGSA